MNYKVPLVKPVQKDYDEIEDKPIEDVIVEKKDGDIYEWNLIFHIENVKEGDSFNDQLYFGQITFPQAYPFEPPTIKICKIPNIEAPKKPLYLPITEDWRFCTARQPAPQFPINNARYTTQLYPHIFEYIHAENFYKHIIPSEMDSIMGRSEAFRLPIPPSFVELSVWEEQPIWLHDQLDNAILIGLTTVDRMFDCLVQLQDRNVQRFNLVTIYENFDQHVYDLVAKVLSNFITVMDPTMLPSKIQINFHEHVYLQSEFITNLRQENSSSNTTFEVQSGPNFRRIIFQRQDRWKLSIELQRYTEGNNGHFKLEIIDS
uniref:UBC core domain-containing protein n=1 Tax=Acrobeloides nanus TaxID=290746 RepID=A0A914CVT4_9BILA